MLLKIEKHSKMLLLTGFFHGTLMKSFCGRGRLIFFLKLSRKYEFLSLLWRFKIKTHFPLKSPFLYSKNEAYPLQNLEKIPSLISVQNYKICFCVKILLQYISVYLFTKCVKPLVPKKCTNLLQNASNFNIKLNGYQNSGDSAIQKMRVVILLDEI